MTAPAPTPLFDWARWNGRARKSTTSTTGRPPIGERYRSFILANPHVLEEALHLARGKLASGAKRIGAKALWEELRTSIHVKKLGAYKLNNDYTALLARELISIDPRLERVIELRERKTRFDKAVDETTPLQKDDAMPTLIDDDAKTLYMERDLGTNELGPSGLRLVVTADSLLVTASIQRLSNHPLFTTRPHFVTVFKHQVEDHPEFRSERVRAAVLHVMEQWAKITGTLVEILNGID